MTTGPTRAPVPDDGGSPRIELEEIAALMMRRRKAGVGGKEPVWALAFSGGGIRSATFCLGLARALAKNGLFERFDYLSTVSGGGYVGGAIGRLFSEDDGAAEVSAGLANDKSLFLWWLRRNGRFLLPAGFVDVLQAGASYLRGLVATQWEVGVLLALMSCIVVLPHLLMGACPGLDALGLKLFVPWWSMTIVLAPLCTAVYFGFWFARDSRAVNGPGGDGNSEAAEEDVRRRDLSWAVLFTLLLGIVVYAVTQVAPPTMRSWALAAGLFGAGLPIGYLLSRNFSTAEAPKARLIFTRWFSRLLALVLVLAAVGLLDLLTWIAAGVLSSSGGHVFSGAAGSTAVLILLLRAAVPAAKKFVGDRGSLGAFAPEKIAHWIGLSLTVVLALLWLTAVQWIVFFASVPAIDGHPQLGAVLRWLALLIVLVPYALLTGPNLDQLNRSSLYSFYRSRLARTYISLGNRGRFKRNPLRSVEHFEDTGTAKVVDVVAGDDPKMEDYAPHRFGGPIHLVNVCINLTKDDRTGTYNADRKGMNLAVSPLGMERGTEWSDHRFGGRNSTLAQWTAISGAAVGSGMGSITTTGLAALTFLTGVRLGFWFEKGPGAIGHFAKYQAILREWFGRFPGIGNDNPVVNLSDGGQFDNTGVYALLKRQPALIVAADCGADPLYCFEDLENLIRKARIDYRAEIEVIEPASLSPLMFPTLPLGLFGTPDTIVPEPGRECLVLARIRYERGPVGALLLVKPRRIVHLSVDVAGYSDRDRSFPQQTTGDQFFDESQWESYCQLGLHLGHHLTPALALDLRLAVEVGAVAATRSITGPESDPSSVDGASASRRERFGSTVRQSIGIGAALSAGIAVWQGFESMKSSSEQSQREESKAVDELLNPPEKPAPAGAATCTGGCSSTQAPPPEPVSLVEQALRETRGIAGLGMVVRKLEAFRALKGDDLQASAIGTISDAVEGRCFELGPSTKGAATDGSTLTFRQCAKAITVLSQAQHPWYRNGLWDYQDDARQRIHAAPETCGGPIPPRVVLHGYDRGEDRRLDRLGSAIEDAGVPVHKGEIAQLRVLDRLFATRTAMDNLYPGEDHTVRKAMLIAGEFDAACAESLVEELQASSIAADILPLSTELAPAFHQGFGQMQLVLLEAGPSDDAIPIPTASAPPPPAPETAPGSTGFESLDLTRMFHADRWYAFPGDGTKDLALNLDPGDQLSPKVKNGAMPSTPASAPVAVTAPAPADRSPPAGMKASRLVYVQFKGSVTRAQINAYLNDVRSKFANVPGAERVPGNYGNIVKYFRPDARDDALKLVDETNAYFSAGGGVGCPLDPPVTAVSATAVGDPAQLEVWISPICGAAGTAGAGGN